MQETPKPEKRERLDWKKFYGLIRDTKVSKVLLTLAIGLSLIQTLASLIVPWFTKNLVDDLSATSLSPGVIGLLAGAFLLQAIAGAISTYFLFYVGESVVLNLRRKLWNKTLVLPVSYFDQHRSGDIISRISNDTLQIKDLVSNHLVTMFSSVISIIGAIAVLFYLDWQMSLVILGILPVIFLLIRPMGRKIYFISRDLQKETAGLTSMLTQIVSEIRLVKSYVAEDHEKDQGSQKISHLFQFGLREAKIISILQPLIFLLMTIMLVAVIGYGGVRVATGALTAGELVAFILYLFQVVTPMSLFARFFTSLQKAMGATERLHQILDWDEELEDEGLVDVKPTKSLKLDHVRFGYGDNDPVIRNVSLEIPPGKVTAIVGPSGAGKTTLFSLLERFYQPTDGQIYQGGTPIEDFSLRAWRSQFGYVSQESPLLAGTIRENICYGMKREVTEEELKYAAKLANALEFIEELPQSLDTEVGERGIKLSGGQRQRIAIARALLQDPAILMLDEATSNLDSQSEVAVQQALQTLMEGRTTLVIAHRLATVVHADQIVVLEKGEVTGTGTHHELLENHSLYQELVQHQFQRDLMPGVVQEKNSPSQTNS
ncbi:ABC transporter ATP-binding protein [Risungbinella massiliensis]|uniref:ABC transporter ATP-binding protein n=1 Tax=Risungbinella massiliensis TaxID=1329796 RepID=UPI0005CBF2F5|nr:ABC transporter ATP-binding protein [Risungbinella massiliensis]